MADRRQQPHMQPRMQQQPQPQAQPSVVTKIDALYSWLSYDLQRMRAELMNELKLASVQTSSLYQELKADKTESAQAITQEIRYSYKQNQTIYDGLAAMLTEEVGDRLNSMDETMSALDEKFSSIEQVRALNEELISLVSGDVVSRLALLEKIDATLVEINEKLGEGYQKVAEGYEKIEASLAGINEKLGDGYDKVADSNRQILEAVEGIPSAIVIPEVNVPEVDYARIASDVEEKIASATVAVDYNKIINGSAEKVIEAMPYPEKVDYRRITEIAENAVVSAVEKALSALDFGAIANAVAEKIANPEIDYDRLADLVVAKLAANTEKAYEVVLDDDGVDRIADKVCEKISVPESIDYERVYQAAQAAQIMPEPIDYDRIAEIVEEKQNATYDLVIDSDGIDAISSSVSEKLCEACKACEEVGVADATEEVCVEAVEEVEVVEEVVEEPAEEVAEVVEEATEEPAEEVIVEDVVEEQPIEEVVEEPVVEEPIIEEDITEVRKEIAVSVGTEYEEIDNQLVDAETGLVIRLKKSFTAKIRQSDEKVKGYYSDLKNELTSYKKINSNVSWHGDRFNFGRDTIAKINICGKTLCFYLALDPNDPEYKSTVYHQKDVGNQKAYESTPFMVKVKSDAAAKKALRLVGYLAEKVGTEKDEGFVAVDYVEEYRYQSTKQLFEDGYIKVTKEKKVDLDF